MKLLLPELVLTLLSLGANAQCFYIPSTSTNTDTLSYVFSGGSFQSYGCAPIDPTRWISGNGMSITVNFVNPEDCPSFRVWGMNDDDIASVTVNSVSYPLNTSSAWYDPKVVCGLSPGPDGVYFIGGNLIGSNTPAQGNYSYSDVHLSATGVTTMTITGLAGAGWGFAGVLVNCPCLTDIAITDPSTTGFKAFPNPFNHSTTINFQTPLSNGAVLLMNTFGQTVRSYTSLIGSELIIDKAELPAGVYFVAILENEHVISGGKLVIQN